MDAVPGRLNETWFKAEQPGIYFGQCYELCGSRHAYMPIAVEVVSQEDFARWVASKGGTMPGAPAGAAVNPDSTQANTMGQRQAAEKPEKAKAAMTTGCSPPIKCRRRNSSGPFSSGPTRLNKRSS
jgi:cytochrome c oxidase subunit 2